MIIYKIDIHNKNKLLFSQLVNRKLTSAELLEFIDNRTEKIINETRFDYGRSENAENAKILIDLIKDIKWPGEKIYQLAGVTVGTIEITEINVCEVK